MKNIIIAGIPLSGKTTLARKILHNYPYNLIQDDILDCAIEAMYLKYISEQNEEGAYIIKIPELIEIEDYVLERYFDISSTDNIYYGTILETYRLNMEKLKEYEENGAIVIVLGCADLTHDEFFENVRAYETPLERTYYLSNFKLDMAVKSYVKDSREQRKKCQELGLTYIETSHDREASIEKAYQIIKEKLKETKKVSID